MKEERNLSVWFPDVEVIREIRREALATERGIGYVICKNWRERNMKKKNKKEKREINENCY